ncbi:MAG: redox-sensing transcriptional repressor Rex [Syntrophomonadaceae bacterium]
MKAYKIPEATVIRLSIYSRQLSNLRKAGVETVSSEEIANSVGVSSAQVRKDLAYFGEFGTRGVGYRVNELLGNLTNILGLNKEWNLAIIGAGKLGSALALYEGFRQRGFSIRAILDVDVKRIGIDLAGVVVDPLDKLEALVQERDINIGIITVPAAEAQNITDRLVAAGVGAILNFSPQVLRVPPDVLLRNVDLAVNLKVLSFNLSHNH